VVDIEILKFYNSVKDPIWPEIRNYIDFCNLPSDVKRECYSHGFYERKLQIESVDYWINLSTDVYVFKNLAFVPVPKCAYMYHTALFKSLGWEKKFLGEVDTRTTHFLGTVIHPMTRWLKGIAEWLVESYTEGPLGSKFDIKNTNWSQLQLVLQTAAFQKLLSSVSVGDLHSMPYSVLYSNLLTNAFWIPMDAMSDNKVKIKMMEFFKRHGHDIVLPLDDKRIHVSSPEQLEIFNIIKKLCLKNHDQLQSFYKLYSNDLKFYSNLIEINTI